jgi:hypothetical protein
MSCEINNNFSTVTSIGKNNLINQLEDNMKSFLDWGLLNIGGYVNINIPTSGLNNNIGYHKLRPVQEPGFSNYRVWQTIKKDWVWESGVTYNNSSPNRVSGIVVNGTGYAAPTGSGAYSYKINYPLGRIIFNNPINSGTDIQLSYSYRWCQVYKSSTNPWWIELQRSTFNTDQLQTNDQGDFVISANHRVQLPCIIIEPISRTNMIPNELGSHEFRINQDILLHVFANNASHRNDIVDIIRLQKDKVIQLYDLNKINNIYGLNYYGSIIPTGLSYCQIINDSNYQWRSCYFREMSVMDMESLNFNLSWCTLRVTSEIII